MPVLNDVGFALQASLVYLTQTPWLLAALLFYGGCFAVLASEDVLRAHSGAGALLVDEVASVATLAWNPLDALSADGVILVVGVWILGAAGASCLMWFRHRWENAVGEALFRYDSAQVLFKHFFLPEIERETFLLFCVSLFSMVFDFLAIATPRAASATETARCFLLTIVGALIFHAMCSGFIFDSRNPRFRYSGLLTWWFVNGISRFYTALADHPTVTVLGLVAGSWRHLPVVLLIGCLSTMPVTWAAGWVTRTWPGQDLTSMGCRNGGKILALVLCSLWAARSADLSKGYILASAYRLSPASLWMGTLIVLFVGGCFAARYWQVIQGFYQSLAIGRLQFEKCVSFQVIPNGVVADVYAHMDAGNPSMTPSAMNGGGPASNSPLIEFLRRTGRHMATISMASNFLSGQRDMQATIQCKLRVSSSDCPRELLLRKPTFEVILVFRTKPRRFWGPSREEKLLATIDLQQDVQLDARVDSADLELEALLTVRFDTLIQLLKAAPNSHLDGFAGGFKLPAVLASMAGSFLPLDDIKLDLVFRSSGALPDYRMPLLGSQRSESTPVKLSEEQVSRLNGMLQEYSTRLVHQMHQPQFQQVKQDVQKLLECKNDNESLTKMTTALHSVCQLAAQVSPSEEEVVVPLLGRVVTVIQQQFFKRVLVRVLKQRSRATLVMDLASIVMFVGLQGLWNATLKKTAHAVLVSAIESPPAVTPGVAPTFEEEPDVDNADEQVNPGENPVPEPSRIVTTEEAHQVVPSAQALGAAAMQRTLIEAAENEAKVNDEAFRYPEALVATWSPAQQDALSALRDMVALRIRLLRVGVTTDAFLNNVAVPHSKWADNALRTAVLSWGDCDWRHLDERLFQPLLETTVSAGPVAVNPQRTELRHVGVLQDGENKSNQTHTGPRQPKTGVASVIAERQENLRKEFHEQNLQLLFELFTRIVTDTFGIEPGGRVEHPHVLTMIARLKEWSTDADTLQLDSEDYWDYFMRELVQVEQQQLVKRAAIRMQALRRLYTYFCHLQSQRDEMAKLTGQRLTETLQSGSPAMMQDHVRRFVKFLAGLQDVLVTIFPDSESQSQDSMLHICNQILQPTAARSLQEQQHEAICDDMKRCLQSVETCLASRWTKLVQEHTRSGNAPKARLGSQRVIAFCSAMLSVQKLFQCSAGKLKWMPVSQVDQIFASLTTLQKHAEQYLASLPASAPAPQTGSPLRPVSTAGTTPACRQRHLPS